MRRVALMLCMFCCCSVIHGASVKLVRVPDDGIQPQVEVDHKGFLHLIYFKGEPMGGDLFYVKRASNDSTFSKPIQVNSIPASIIAGGTVRGAHLALGRNGRVHVAWMSSPVANGGKHEKLPMFYTRLNDAQTGFEPQRNVIQRAYGLDGGGSVAADTLGHVYVSWHAGKDEASRKVWVVRSDDDGKTFAEEVPAWGEETGACGCCGMRAFAEPSGALYVMYRSAKDMVHRDMYVLKSDDYAQTFVGVNVHEWETNRCPMSTAIMASGKANTWAAWESKDQVYLSMIGNLSQIQPVNPGSGEKKNKHPALAQNDAGEVLLAWSIGAGWKKAGTLGYQLFDASGRPLGDPIVGETVPVWSRPAVAALSEGYFVVLY